MTLRASNSNFFMLTILFCLSSFVSIIVPSDTRETKSNLFFSIMQTMSLWHQTKNLPSPSFNSMIFFPSNFPLKVFELHLSRFYEWQMISTQKSPQLRSLDIVRWVNASSSSFLLFPLANTHQHSLRFLFFVNRSELLLCAKFFFWSNERNLCDDFASFPWDAQIRLTYSNEHLFIAFVTNLAYVTKSPAITSNSAASIESTYLDAWTSIRSFDLRSIQSNANRCEVQWSLQQIARESSVNWIIWNFIVRFMWHGTNKHRMPFEMNYLLEFNEIANVLNCCCCFSFHSNLGRHRSTCDVSKVQPNGQSKVMLSMIIMVVIATILKWTMPTMTMSTRCKFNVFRFTDCDWILWR